MIASTAPALRAIEHVAGHVCQATRFRAIDDQRVSTMDIDPLPRAQRYCVLGGIVHRKLDADDRFPPG